ncbi:hypothetical protein [Hufsiella ginkgonis]|uniref:Tail fiber domain-containing protein n=1 Tax=Hufsiella ginkgonis TaxID=2695274 RepID=A0A7K1XU75_9SPHI|nr:hypothetical protein [Hufsiella ginkgonis]MXV14532.1 hypothetical protein [Hufsiella ginkgonis]
MALPLFSQVTNTFPATGNAGIGTLSPTTTTGSTYSGLTLNHATYGGFIDFRQNGVLKGQVWGDINGMNLYAGSELPLRFFTDGNEKMAILPNGHVGIGTGTPSANFQVSGTNPYTGSTSSTDYITISGIGNVGLQVRTSGTNPGDYAALRFNAGGTTNLAAIYSEASTGNFIFSQPRASGIMGFDLNSARIMTILNSGKVGIGTANPDEKLTVNGKVHSTEVIVTAVVGADFVFADDYALKPLAEVEKFVKENKHLPEIAPAAEMRNSGLQLGEMNIRLLQKVEELTLYMIEKDKEIAAQNKKLGDQQAINKALEERLRKLESKIN